jgi:hypothetical protein
MTESIDDLKTRIEGLEIELTKSNNALQGIGMSLGTTDEWADQDAMLHDVEQAVAAQKTKTSDLEKELGRAYRCIRGFWTVTHKGEVADRTMLAYHSPTIGAACRFVADGSLDGAEYFIGKQVDVLHAALKL